MCVAESENVGSTPACYPIQPVGVNRSEPSRRGYDGGHDGLPGAPWPSPDAVWQVDRVRGSGAGAGRKSVPAWSEVGGSVTGGWGSGVVGIEVSAPWRVPGAQAVGLTRRAG